MKNVNHLLRFFVLIGLILGTVLPVSALPQPLMPGQGGEPAGGRADLTEGARAKIEPLLFEELKARTSTDFFVWLADKADLSPAYRLQTKEEKGRFVFDTLRAYAERSQQDLRAYLDAQDVKYEPYYISNKILVRGGSQELLQNLAERPDVARLTANHKYQLEEPRVNPKGVEGIEAVGPNISFVNADDVWALGFTGQGTILAGNDTGLDWQHPAILDHYRGWNGVVADHNYNWWDATGMYPTAPADGFGHGTHTTGTMVGDDGGDNQIGMAPGAKTIHCKNMDDWGGGYDEWFIQCFQWDLAPWDLGGANPRPDLAPDAINNSWGYWGGGYPIFEDEIAALQAAGILVEVSAGNDGPGCGTLGSPGDYGEVLTTGSVSHASGALPGSLTWFSSRGPSTLSPDYLPDVMAPGENVRSAVPGGGYEGWDGTSMSGPHVTGLIGLMWAANPGLRGLVPETQQILWVTSVPLAGQTGSTCGGDYTTGPNHDWGYGTVDALAAVQAAMSYGGVGTLSGTVTDSSSGDPLAGVKIRASLAPDLTWQALTNDQGQYARAVFSGTYTVTAELYGYYSAEYTGVEVISGTTTILDIPLDPAPSYLVSGQVTDATTGWPLYASIDIDGYPGPPVWTDPVSGQYSVSLAAGLAYTFRVRAWVAGYETAIRAVGPLGSPQTEDFALAADLMACAAPGYQPEFIYFEDFEAVDGGYTPEGYTSWAWGAPTSGPRSAHSGANAWATNLSGDYSDGEYGILTSPEVDLSAYAGQSVVVTWWQWLQTEECCDFGSVEVSNDGGASWMAIYGPDSGQVNTVWTKYSIPIDPSYAVSNFRVRFILATDWSVTGPGFYLDDVGVGIAEPLPNFYAEDFEADNGGYTDSGVVTSWAWGVPTRGPGGAHSGLNVWATNLNGNYGDNEDGYVTSPVIDLSAGATGFESLELSWWQWLQTESGYDFASVDVTGDGIAWTEIITTSGIQNTEWTEVRYYLDPVQYATSGFQVRFRLQSDGSVTYPGFYLDDVRVGGYTPAPPSLPCNPPTGGLAVGNVYDDNSGSGLNGALVASSSLVAHSQATPADDAVDDGFYTLYGDAGSQVITATMTGGYGADVQAPVIPAGGTVLQNFALPAGWLAYDPLTLEATVDMGSVATLPFTLTNAGSLEATYELRERDLGFIPTLASRGSGEWLYRSTEGVELLANRGDAGEPALAYPSAYRWQPELAVAGGPSILVYSDDPYHPAPNTYVDQALQYLGLPYTAHYDGDFDGFRTDLAVGGWDLVVFADDNWLPFDLAPLLADLNAYASSGGRLVLHTWGVSRLPTDPLWATLGFTWADDNYEPPAPVYWWDPAHPMFTDPLEVPEFTALSGYRYGIYGQYVEPLPGFAATAGYTTPGPDPNQAALILDDSSNSLFRAFLDGQNDADLDGDGLLDGIELWIDLISGMQYGFSADVPWLSTDVVSGTLAASGQQAIEASLDASVPEVTQPGQYLAELRLVDDTPYHIDALPVIMTVNPPSGWGKLGGTVTGLARCDEPGAPLPVATVDIHGVALVEPDDSGAYSYWMPAGSYTVTISADGYLSQTVYVTVVAGQTSTQDLDLRLDAPCTSLPVTALEATVTQGYLVTEALTLENGGAGELMFTFLESPFDLGEVISPAGSLAPPAGFQLSPQTGPASFLTLAGQATGGERQELPLSGWFGGLDLPGGLVRYAHAQCAEQPESFYLFGGVDNSYNTSRKAWRYDATANEWTQLADMPSGGEAPVAACYGGKVYVMGGSGTDQFYIYDLGAGTWSPGAPLPRGVEGAAAAAWAGKVYLVGGDDDFAPYTGVSDQVDIYDIATDTWIGSGTPLPVGVGNAGFVQTGPYLYVVGGWGVAAPTANLTTTLRYNLEAGTWQAGPTFTAARADLALAATDSTLYAIGGDQQGSGFFDATKAVDRLDLAAWPAGAWTDAADPLPIEQIANNAGFCTQALFDSDVAETWSVAGADRYLTIGGRTLFREAPGQACYSIYGDVPWLSVLPTSGELPGGSTAPVTITFDASGLAPGNYAATLVIRSNDGGQYLTYIPVRLTVEGIRIYLLPTVLKGYQP